MSGSVSNEINFSVTAFENAVCPLSCLDPLELHHHTRSLHRASWCLSFHLQLLRLLCSEFGSFASLCFELCSIPKHLLTLVSETGASQGRPSLSKHGL